MVRILLALFIGLVASTAAQAGEIPLKSIWALDMPGTKDVRELDPRTTSKETLIGKINRVFFTKLDEGAEPGRCFVVKGEGKDALEHAEKVLVHNEPRLKNAPQGAVLSLVFYAHPVSGYLHIDSVQYSEGQLTVNYKVVAHAEANATSHFALIPLPTDLPKGKLSIKSVRVPTKDEPNAAQASKKTERAVCESCFFIID